MRVNLAAAEVSESGRSVYFQSKRMWDSGLVELEAAAVVIQKQRGQQVSSPDPMDTAGPTIPGHPPRPLKCLRSHLPASAPRSLPELTAVPTWATGT